MISFVLLPQASLPSLNFNISKLSIGKGKILQESQNLYVMSLTQRWLSVFQKKYSENSLSYNVGLEVSLGFVPEKIQKSPARASSSGKILSSKLVIKKTFLIKLLLNVSF